MLQKRHKAVICGKGLLEMSHVKQITLQLHLRTMKIMIPFAQVNDISFTAFKHPLLAKVHTFMYHIMYLFQLQWQVSGYSPLIHNF